MKTLSAAVLLLGGLLACQRQEDNSPLTMGRVVRTEMTADSRGQNARPRWVVDVAPLSFAGLGGRPYQQVKAFGLPDTAVCKAGRSFQFHYRPVPYEQQTPWKTNYERFSVPAMPPGATALPELALFDVQP